MRPEHPTPDRRALASGTPIGRRALLGAGLSTGAALACSSLSAARGRERPSHTPVPAGRNGARPVLVGSANALPGMRDAYPDLVAGADPLDAAIATVKVVEADPEDTSVGLGGLPNEDGVVQLDAAVMYGPTHNSGAVACLENILHPSEVARLVMERTDHCLLVGRGAYRFAREHGHPHVELLTDASRREWLAWKETMSAQDDRFPPATDPRGVSRGGASPVRSTGTIHCSAVSSNGSLACTTTTSGLAYKIPGRVGDSPIVGAGLYCDQEAGSAGSTGRGEATILANGSFAIVELLRQGAAPLDAGLEVLRRITRQAQRASAWQPGLVDAEGVPNFHVHFYVLGLDGGWAGVTMKAKEREFAVADPDGGPRLEPLVPLHA